MAILVIKFPNEVWEFIVFAAFLFKAIADITQPHYFGTSVSMVTPF
jgi:hypothetical protein